MNTLLKKRGIIFVIGMIGLLGINYYFFRQTVVQETETESISDEVTAVLEKNDIQVSSVPAIYNIKEKEKIAFMQVTEIKENAIEGDQILYFKAEKLLILYRPETKEMITAVSLTQ